MNTKSLIAFILVSLTLIKDGCLAICVNVQDICPNPLIKFYLYKSETLSAGPILLDPLQLNINDFLPLRPIKILLHGYNGGRDISPNAEVRPALLETQHVNVISADYGGLVEEPCYPTAVANAPVIAKCLAQLIENLIANEISENANIHLIGFSLGAQIAGITANYTSHKLSRITGLDPAGPLYDTTLSNSKKLDATDATFVDVIHSDWMIYGTSNLCGTVDFKVNYPSYPQKGCPFILFDDKCSHFRSPAYYAESIRTATGFWSTSSPKVLMGYFVSESVSGVHVVNTNAAAPFAKGP